MVESVTLGNLACQNNSYLRTLETSIVEIVPSEEVEEGCLDVMLQDTVFFPTGGGQPNDIGTITVAGGHEIFQVVDVFRAKEGNQAIHRVKLRDVEVEGKLMIG
jgi:misacylated tRNA(Ala) deacylase